MACGGAFSAVSKVSNNKPFLVSVRSKRMLAVLGSWMNSSQLTSRKEPLICSTTRKARFYGAENEPKRAVKWDKYHVHATGVLNGLSCYEVMMAMKSPPTTTYNCTDECFSIDRPHPQIVSKSVVTPHEIVGSAKVCLATCIESFSIPNLVAIFIRLLRSREFILSISLRHSSSLIFDLFFPLRNGKM